METVIQIGIVLLLVFLNGFFVASEFALVSLRKTRIAELVKKGNRRAKLIQKAQENLDMYISGTQLGITLVSLALGWIGEPFLAHVFEGIFANFLPAYLTSVSSHSVAVILAFSIITFLHIVWGELAPKTLALTVPEKVSMIIVAPLMLFTTIFKPFIYLLNGAGLLTIRLLGFNGSVSHHAAHSEEEIKMLLSQSAKSGNIEKKEADMAARVFRLGDAHIKKIMTRRQKIQAFPASKTLRELEQTLGKHPHSRFPVYKNSLHSILGFVHLKDFYRALSQDKYMYKPLQKIRIIRPILFVREKKELDEVLLLMRKRRIHMAIIRDKHNKTVGLVTLEDIVESLVGEIEDEFETSSQKNR